MESRKVLIVNRIFTVVKVTMVCSFSFSVIVHEFPVFLNCSLILGTILLVIAFGGYIFGRRVTLVGGRDKQDYKIDCKSNSWFLPMAPRCSNRFVDPQDTDLVLVVNILESYEVDVDHGFLPRQDPISRLPHPDFTVWENIASDLPKLLGARMGQARGPLRQMPVVSTENLHSTAELRRAHLLLCLFAHAYVFGGNEPLDTLPPSIAVPLCQVAARLGLPPVLGHPSIVLFNWRRLDPQGALCMENLSTLNNFLDGRDESWFYLITVEVEAKGAAAILPVLLAVDAIERFHSPERSSAHADSKKSESSFTPTQEKLASLQGNMTDERVMLYVSQQLRRVTDAITAMSASLAAMREGCHPFIFYHRVRPFLSGWKHNPALPQGVFYSGVDAQRLQYFGGSAAQSSLLPFLDIALGVRHDAHRSTDFLLAMREYMLRPHREFLTYLEGVANVRAFLLEMKLQHCVAAVDGIAGATSTKQGSTTTMLAASNLVATYDAAVASLKSFRSIHMTLVADYILAQQRASPPSCLSPIPDCRVDGNAGRAERQMHLDVAHASASQPLQVPRVGLEHSAGGKGTGGTDLMKFLRPLRDDCSSCLLNKPVRAAETKLLRPRTLQSDFASTVATSIAVPLPQPPSDVWDELLRDASPAPDSAVAVAGGGVPHSDSSSSFYHKDNGSCADIDLYRGATSSRYLPSTV